MESFFIALNAVLPFILYMSFGYLIRSAGFCDIAFLRKLNGFSFKAFFPLLMFSNIYNMNFSNAPRPVFFLFTLFSVVILILLTWAFVPKVVKDRTRVPVVMQGIYRSNILFFAVPLALQLFGEEAVALATANVVLIVPLYNAFAVVFTEMYCGKERSSLKELIINCLKNPLIAGVLAGLLFRFAGIHIPEVLRVVIKQYSDMTTPLALFILGGTLQFSSLKKNFRTLVTVTFLKMVFIPAIILVIAHMIGLTTVESFLVFIVFATPVATASFPMAQAMGADAQYAGEQVVLTTTTAVFSLFLWIFFLGNLGFFA